MDFVEFIIILGCSCTFLFFHFCFDLWQCCSVSLIHVLILMQRARFDCLLSVFCS
uniref:Uncharacterized protein n=1 Tax=Kalanchoe fedtschenkoi TaxID=63787 RepID=A0A7N0UJJ1_KALFE